MDSGSVAQCKAICININIVALYNVRQKQISPSEFANDFTRFFLHLGYENKLQVLLS